MTEWLIQNTNIKAEEYDEIINPNTINIRGISEEKEDEMFSTIFEHPMLAIERFAFQKPNIFYKIVCKVKGKRKNYIHRNIKLKY